MTYYYVVTAVDDANNESGYSSEANVVPAYQTCADVFDGGDRLDSDLDSDCYVDLQDLMVFASNWLFTDCITPDNCQNADFAPTDGVVDFLDFADLAQQWLLCNNPQDVGCINNW